MMRHELQGSPDPIDRTRFPVDEWAWRETWYSTDDLGLTETVFAVGNGYLGMRGNVEEGRDVHAHGTFINGFHETWQIRHAEEAFGFAQTGQTIVNVPDVKTIKVYVDDEPLMLSLADLQEYERTLDFRDGVLRRSLVWRTPSGKRVLIESSRMVSFEQRHLAVMTFDVTLLDADAPGGDLVADPQPPGRHRRLPRVDVGPCLRPAPGLAPRRAGARPPEPLGERPPHRAQLSLRQLRHDPRRGCRPRHLDRLRLRGAEPRRGGPRQEDLPRHGPSGATDPYHQGGGLPHLAGRADP